MDNKAMFNLSYGLFVLTARENDRDSGCIINTAMQVSTNPNQIAICVNKANYTCSMIERTSSFTISIISEKASFELFKHFGFSSGRDIDKFANFKNWKRGSNGLAYITEETNSYISVKVNQTVDLFSHIMFIGEITDMKVLSDDKSATYAFYFENIKPKPEKVGKTQDGQTIWRCIICGYEYIGDKLPEDYICPICKHGANDFEKVIEKPKENKESKTIWRCSVCGYEYEGEKLPENFICPICTQGSEVFEKV